MSLPSDPQPPAPPWGPGATIAWTVMAFVMSILVTGGLYSIWAGDAWPSSPNDGLALTFWLMISNPVQLGVVIYAAQLRRWPPAEYLGLVLPRRSEVAVALVCTAAMALLFDGFLYFSGREVVPSSMLESWRSAADSGWLPWLVIGVVVVAPIGEEVLFRGFLFRGLAMPGWEVHAIGGIALVWALLHVQYDLLVVAQIFLLGLVLGWFRWVSGSTLLTIGMHMLFNLEAMIETWIKVEYFP